MISKKDYQNLKAKYLEQPEGLERFNWLYMAVAKLAKEKGLTMRKTYARLEKLAGKEGF